MASPHLCIVLVYEQSDYIVTTAQFQFKCEVARRKNALYANATLMLDSKAELLREKNISSGMYN